MRKRLTVTAVIVLVVALAAGAAWWWRAQQTEVERAVAFAPAASERITWTDWRGIRADLDADLDEGSSARQVAAFLDRGYDADLTSTSALLGSAEAMHERFGFSPATLEWEVLSQSGDGAVLVMQLAEGVGPDEVADRLEGLGYSRPDSETGVWRGGPDLAAGLGVTPELQHVALDPEERLVLASDSASHLGRVVDDLGDEELPEPLTNVVEASADARSAVFYTGDHVCRALAMGTADADAKAQAEQLLGEAGEVHPLAAYAMSEQPSGDIRVVMAFETEEQARTNADTRAKLAAGPAPGQGGDFSDRFDVGSVTADGRLLTMALEPHDGEYVLSDLSAGPVLFATC